MSYQLVFVEAGSPEWDRVWGLLAADTGGDFTQACGCCGEVWQYMGSFTNEDGTAHEFRHRHCPATGQREYRRFYDVVPIEHCALVLRPVRDLLAPGFRALIEATKKGGPDA